MKTAGLGAMVHRLLCSLSVHLWGEWVHRYVARPTQNYEVDRPARKERTCHCCGATAYRVLDSVLLEKELL